MKFYTYVIVKASLNSPVINQWYLIVTHTFSAVTAYSSFIDGRVDSLLLPCSKAEGLLLLIRMQCERLHGIAL
jgi:hypothetical protein